MIVFLLSDLGRARRLSKAIHLDYEGVDGPFRIFEGDIGGPALCIYVVEGNADAAYGAARIAARRGAKVLIPICVATIAARFADDNDIAPGALVPVSRIYDLAGLREPMRILPDSCQEFPFDLEEVVPKKALWKSDSEGVVVGTLHERIRNHFLASRLLKTRDIACIDRQLAGFAAASNEEDLELRPVAFIDSVIARDGLHAEIPLGLEKTFDEAVLAIGKASRP